MYSALHVRPTYQFLLSYDYRLPSTEYLITFPLSETVTARAPCHEISNRGQKLSTFKIPDPNFSLHFVTFTALRRRLSHVMGKK